MLKIEVTAEDIANGKPEDCEACPIALAMKRTIQDLEWIEVDGDAQWATSEGDFRVRFPGQARDFISRFDAGKSVDPFAFECEPRLKNYYCDYRDDD